MHANQRLLEGVKGGGVEHLLLDLGAVWAPGHEEQLLLLAGLRSSLTLVLVLEVVQAVPENRLLLEFWTDCFCRWVKKGLRKHIVKTLYV